MEMLYQEKKLIMRNVCPLYEMMSIGFLRPFTNIPWMRDQGELRVKVGTFTYHMAKNNAVAFYYQCISDGSHLTFLHLLFNIRKWDNDDKV